MFDPFFNKNNWLAIVFVCSLKNFTKFIGHPVTCIIGLTLGRTVGAVSVMRQVHYSVMWQVHIHGQDKIMQQQLT